MAVCLSSRFGSPGPRGSAVVGLGAARVRFDHAAHRLAAGDSVARVSAESGYVDQSYLSRATAAFTGLTPAAPASAPWLSVDDVAWAGRPYATATVG